jgi:GNAT superfamily N-acetyltransferase
MPGVALRKLDPGDYQNVIAKLDAWWGGRHMSDMLPKLFFVHFASTSLAAVTGDGSLAGFLVGFVSPTLAGEAYIHFVGVDPQRRGEGLGRRLYEAFFDLARARGCDRVTAVTSPVNTGSIAFHLAMGFEPQPGAQKLNGIWVHPDYDGPGEDRVVFKKAI